MPSYLQRRKFAKNEKMSSVTTHQGNRHISRGRGLLPSHPANFLSQECSDICYYFSDAGSNVEVLGYVTVLKQEPRTRLWNHLTFVASSNMWLSQRRRVEMLVVVVRAHKNGNMMEDVTCQSWTYSPPGRWGPYSAPLGRVDQHSRCMHDCRCTYVGLQVFIYVQNSRCMHIGHFAHPTTGR